MNDPEIRGILCKRPEILTSIGLLFLEVIKRRANVFTPEFATALNLLLDCIPLMSSLNAKEAEDILSVVINFSYDEQIDKTIDIEKKMKAYLHCLIQIAPHNWSNRTQIRFLFWGFPNDATKTKNAIELLKFTSKHCNNFYRERYNDAITKISQIKSIEEMKLWGF